jgi:hypothetical protein
MTLREHVLKEIEQAKAWRNEMKAGITKLSGPVRPGYDEFIIPTDFASQALREWFDEATGESMGYSGTKAQRLQTATRRLKAREQAKSINFVMWDMNAYTRMTEKIGRLADDIFEGKVKMHLPEYLVVVNVNMLAFLEGHGFIEDDSIEDWVSREDNEEVTWNGNQKYRASDRLTIGKAGFKATTNEPTLKTKGPFIGN